MKNVLTFYVLQPPYLDEEYPVYGKSSWESEFGRATWADEVTSETIRCAVYPGHQRAGERIGNLTIILPALRVEDLVWTWYSDCLITNNVLRLLQKANFTGFTVKPVQIKLPSEEDRRLDKVPTLWELIITGKGGDADPKSGIRQIYTCPHCSLVEYSSFHHGIIVNEREWDGSDFFTVNGYPKFIFVTERVKDFVIEHGMANCALVPSQDIRWGTTVRPEDVYNKNNGE